MSQSATRIHRSRFDQKDTLFKENARSARCKFCKQLIEWVKDNDGRWLAARVDLMGEHKCPGSMVPRFDQDQREENAG